VVVMGIHYFFAREESICYKNGYNTCRAEILFMLLLLFSILMMLGYRMYISERKIIIFNIYNVDQVINGVRQTEMHTAEELVKVR
jgi:hypothetical protein